MFRVLQAALRMFLKSLIRIIDVVEKQNPVLLSSSAAVGNEGITGETSAQFGIIEALTTASRVLKLSKWQEKVPLDDAAKLAVLRCAAFHVLGLAKSSWTQYSESTSRTVAFFVTVQARR